MDLLHEYCEGYIDPLEPENYGRCEKCGEEGLFRVVREKDGNAFAIFYEVSSSANLLFRYAVMILLLPLVGMTVKLHTARRLLEIVVSFFCNLILNTVSIVIRYP